MSAEVLRRAASLMRERVEAATGGGWHSGGVWWEHWTDAEGLLCHTPWPTVTTGSTGSEIVAKTCTEANAEHVATFADPDVGLAVADWLEAFSECVADDPELAASYTAEMDSALAVARAYLGELS